jgi:dTDP-4-amino-4,6-dideoxy-D-galactose acyltransferase
MPATEAAPARLLAWDSEFWGFPIGQVNGASLSAEGAAAVDEWAEENGVACVFFEAPAEDAQSIWTAEAAGFRNVEIRVVLRGKRPQAEPPMPPTSDFVTVRLATPEDLPRLREIARESFHDSRFYVDPRFPDDRAGDFYATWVERSLLEGWRDNAVVVPVVEGRVRGFATFANESPILRIDLIALDAEARSGTAGGRISHTLGQWLIDYRLRNNLYVRAVTQARNVRTQRFIMRWGLWVDGISTFFHKWYER